MKSASGVTLKQIAEELGISISTASRALKDHPRIGAPTRERVKRTARRMGYRSLDLLDAGYRKSNLIGVIVPSINYHLYAMAISGIERTAEQHGMHIIVCQSNESYQREKSLVKELLAAGVNGILVSLASETRDFTHFREVMDKGLPLVFFNRECQDIETDKVVIDNQGAAFEATSHLLSVGCRKIAYLGGPESLQINRDRASGYQRALQQAGLTMPEQYLVFSKFDRDSTLSAARKLLYTPDYPDGILAFSDQIAISVMLAAKERGIEMPGQLSVIGFNNEPVDELLEPSLTSIDQPAFSMGEQAAMLLTNQINSGEQPYQTKVLRSSLVVRRSTNKNEPNT